MNEQSEQSRRVPTLTPGGLLVVLLIFYLVVEVRIVVLLFLLAILFATVIEGPVRRLERRGMPRSAGILSVYAVILLGLVLMFSVFVPIVSSEAREFARQAPDLVDQLAENWRTSDNPILSSSGYRLLARLQFQLENPPAPAEGTAVGLVGRVAAVGLGLVAMFVIGFYWLMEKRLLRQLVATQFTDRTGERITRLWDNVEGKVGGWLRGQLILCLVVGTLAGVGYAVLGLRFWLLLAVLAGIMELIPIIGPWIGGIPAVMIALIDSWQKALIVAVFLLLLQLLENTVLVPRIMKGTIGLSPLTVFVAVLAGGAFMGPLGALLSIPFAAAIQVIIVDSLAERRRNMFGETRDDAEAPAIAANHTPGWRGIFSRYLEPSKPPVKQSDHMQNGGGLSARDAALREDPNPRD